MKTIQVKLYDPDHQDSKWTTFGRSNGTTSPRWNPFLRSRFDTTVLVAKSSAGYSYPIRNVIKQIDPRTIEIISEAYTVAMLQRLASLQKDFTFPVYQVKIKERDGWKH